jgi:hypothetical protein
MSNGGCDKKLDHIHGPMHHFSYKKLDINRNIFVEYIKRRPPYTYTRVVSLDVLFPIGIKESILMVKRCQTEVVIKS